MRAAAALFFLVLVAAGCGSSTSHARAATPARMAMTPACRVKIERAQTRLDRDLASVRSAASRPSRDKLKGNAAVNEALDRFLLDLARAPLDLKVKNRMIDHAAAAVVATCEQCFQALEASRPIPAIAHEGSAGACG